MSHAIAVTVTAPEATCFLAMPFSEEFDALFYAIADAANRTGLRPIRTDEIRRQDDFRKEILDRVRRSQVVVAVLSPQGSGGPNLNVVFETGLAFSLRKPCLLLTDDVDSLPSDIDGHVALVYRPEQVGTRPFVERIENRLRELVGRMKARRLTTEEDENVDELLPSHWGITRPNAWKAYVHLLRFAKVVHFRLLALVRELTRARRTLELISRRSAQSLTDRMDFNRETGEVMSLIPPQEFFDTLEKQLRAAEGDIQTLLATTSEGTKARLENCKKNIDILAGNLKSYKENVEQVRKDAVPSNASINAPEARELAERKMELRFRQILDLSTATNQLAINAGNTISSLVDALVEEEDSELFPPLG